MNIKEYQRKLRNDLQNIYSSEIEVEWSSMSGYRNIYSPRVDLAIGPFAKDTRCIEQYNQLINSSRGFLDMLIREHNKNLKLFDVAENSSFFDNLEYFNENARCFLCIEIENKVSRKHLVGGLVNASALGRVGILIPWTVDKLKAFVKLLEYLKFLGSVGKNTFKTENVLILTKEQIDKCIKCYLLKTKRKQSN